MHRTFTHEEVAPHDNKVFNLQHCVGDAASPEVLPLPPSVQPPIISMEEDEMSDQEIVSSSYMLQKSNTVFKLIYNAVKCRQA